MTTRRDQIQRRIEANQAELDRLQAEAEMIDAMPDFGEAPVGTVLGIVTTFRSSTKPFVYVAYKSSPDRWYITGQDGYTSDEGLAEFMTSRTRKVHDVQVLAELTVGYPGAVDLGALLGAFLNGPRD